MGMLGIIASQITTPAQVVTPRINVLLIHKVNNVVYEFTWSVTNMDSETAIIYSERNDTTPDVSRGSIAPGSDTADIYYKNPTPNLTAYAQATVSGRIDSIIASEYLEWGL